MNVKSWNSFLNESHLVKKTLMNMFICGREYPRGSMIMNPNWGKCVEILDSIEFPTSVKVSPSSGLGLGVQVLLDINLEDSISFCEKLLTMFPPEEPLIVLAEVNVTMKDDPIGWWYDDDLVQPGRYFDKLIKEGKTGLVIHDENTPKIIKKHDRRS